MTSSIASKYEALLSVLENAVDAIITIDVTGRILSFNPAAERMFLHSATAITGCNVNLLMPAPHQTNHDNYIRRYLETGERRIIGIGREVDCLRSDGTRFPADLSVSVSGSGDDTVFTGIVRDLTERYRMREKLRRKEQELSLTLQHAPIGIVTLNPGGKLLSINRSGTRMTGYDEKEVVGTDGASFMHVDDQASLRRVFRELITGITEYSSSTHRLRTASGDYIPVRTYNAAVSDAEGRISMLICMFQDLTEQRANEAELQIQRERLTHVARLNTMGEMAVGLAHELNQPLAAISSYAQAGKRLLTDAAKNSADLEHACEQIAMQADRAGGVIHRIRALTKRSVTEKKYINVNSLIADLMTLIEIDAHHADVRLKMNLDEIPGVYADSVQIEQVILNFIRNAIDEVRGLDETKREVLVSTTLMNGDTVRVSVEDQGPGIDRNIAERLFESFFTTKKSGMGMGLAISKSIITAHNGKIGCGSTPEGGAVFWFTLPVVGDMEA